MSIRAMTKRCIHCMRPYFYNPSTKDFGVICKHCHKPQIPLPMLSGFCGKETLNFQKRR